MKNKTKRPSKKNSRKENKSYPYKKSRTKLITILLLSIFMISMVSASFGDIKFFDKDKLVYGEIKVKNWFGIFNKVDYTLTDYEASIINVYAEGEYKLYKKTHLFTGVFYKDIMGNSGNLKNVKFYIWENKTETRYNPIYENQNCLIDYSNSTNGTEVCDSVLISNESYKVDISGWIPYKKGMNLEIGEGKWRLEAERPINKKIDFILQAHDKDFTEWAWWNSSWDFKREITLTADAGNFSYLGTIPYNASMNADFSDLRFVNSAEDTELNYTIENYTASTNAIVRIYSQGATSFYMYYGNADVTTTSNANDTYFNPVSMYYLDDNLATTNVTDAIGANDGTASTNTTNLYNASGKINSAFDLVRTNEEYYTSAVDFNGIDFSVSFWIKNKDTSVNEVIQQGASTTYGQAFYLRTDALTGVFSIDFYGDRLSTSGDYNSTTVYYHVVLTFNNTTKDRRIYVDGSLAANDTSTYNPTPTGVTYFGRRVSGTNYADITLDEVGIWDRVLTQAEITALYNQTAPTYTIGAEEIYNLNPPIITLNAPINNTNSTTNEITFNCTASDNINLVDVSLILDSVVNETNSSGINNTFYYFTKTLSEGTHHWSCRGADNESGVTTAEEFVLNIDTTPQITITSPENITYTTSSIDFNATSSLSVDSWMINYNGTNITSNQSGTNLNENLAIDSGSYHLLLYANNSNTGIWGLNDTIYFTVNLTEPIVTLISPNDSLDTANATILFEANTTTGSYTLNNATIYVWYNNGTLFQNETNDSIAGTSDANVSFNLTDFILGTYKWNVQVNYEVSDLGIYYSTLAANNRTLNIEATLSSITYNNQTYETKKEGFTAEFNINPYSEISLAQLIYNGTNYTIINLTTTTTLLTLQESIDIPLNLNSSANETKSFFFRFTYGGGFVQETEEFKQNVSFINLVLCGGNYTTKGLNFTLRDELNNELINATSNKTTVESFFEYWLGGGNIKKSYSYSQILSTKNSFEYCIYPTDETFKVNMDKEYEAEGYSQRTWYLRNAGVSNVTSDQIIYLLKESFSVKFFIQIRKGVNFVQLATVSVSKFVLGDGAYRTTSIRQTDGFGEFVEYMDLDKTYRFGVVKNGTSLGIIEKQASCQAAPCIIDIQLESPEVEIPTIFAEDVVYTLIFNSTSKKVIFTFEDITGLAKYFELDVIADNKTSICNKQAFVTVGTLICDLGNYTGNIDYYTYVSRSPKKLVDFGKALITALKDVFGSLGILMALFIIITVAFAGVWNPVVGISLTMFAVFMMKYLEFVALGWTTVILIIIMGVILITKIKT